MGTRSREPVWFLFFFFGLISEPVFLEFGTVLQPPTLLFFLAFSAILSPFFAFIQNLQNKIKLIKNPKNIIKTSIKLVEKYLKNITFLAQTNTPTPRFCSSSSKTN